MVDRDCPFCKRAAKILRAKILRGWRLEKDWFGSGSRFTISRLQRFVLFDLFFPAGVWDRETNIENWKPGMQSCARDWMISKMSEWLVERVRCICDDNSVPQTTCWNFKVHAVPMRAWKVQEVRTYRAKEESAYWVRATKTWAATICLYCAPSWDVPFLHWHFFSSWKIGSEEKPSKIEAHPPFQGAWVIFGNIFHDTVPSY